MTGMKQGTKTILEKKKKVVNWGKNHKKELAVVTGVGVGSSIMIVLGIKNKGELRELCDKAWSAFDDFRTPLYSSRWIKKSTTEELHNARRIANTEYSTTGNGVFFNLRNRIDAELSKRAWGDEVPHPPRYHREHGHNLYKAN